MGWISVHVDDTLFSVHGNWLNWFIVTLRKQVVFGEIDAASFAFAGVDLEPVWEVHGQHQCRVPLEIHESQENYVEFLEEGEIAPERRLTPDAKASSTELRDFRGGLGGALWTTATLFEHAHGCSVLASRVNDLKVRDLDELNKLIRRIKKHKGPGIVHRVLRGKLVVVTFGDS